MDEVGSAERRDQTFPLGIREFFGVADCLTLSMVSVQSCLLTSNDPCEFLKYPRNSFFFEVGGSMRIPKVSVGSSLSSQRIHVNSHGICEVLLVELDASM